MMRSRLKDRLFRGGSARLLAAMAAMPLVWCAQPAIAQPAVAAGNDVGAQKLMLAATGLFDRGLFKLAAADYADFVQQFPAHPEINSARFGLGVCRYRLGEFDKAIEQLTLVAQDAKFSKRAEALSVIGHSQLALQKYGPAVAAFDELLAKYPTNPQAQNAALSKTQAFYLAAKYPEAAAAAQDFAKLFPQSPDRPAATFFLGLSQKAMDQNEPAATTLAGLLKEDPKGRFALDATLVLGQALEAQGKLDDAADRFRQMIAAAPALRQPEANYSLAAVLYKQAKYDDAVKAYAAVIEKGPETPYVKPARLQMGLSQLAGGRMAEARRTLAAVATDDAASAPAARYGLAQCDISEKKFDSAIATLDELLKVQPPLANAPQMGFDRAVCLAELGKHEEAAAAFDAFAAANPKTPLLSEAIYREAFSLHKLAKYEQSHAICAKVKDVASEFGAAAQELDAENLFLLGKYENAAAAYTLLVTGAKDDARKNRFAFRLGQCAYSAGDFAKAVTYLQPLAADPKVAADPALGRSGFLLGDSLLQLGQYAKAAEAFGRYLADAKSATGEKADKQEAQYKLAYAQVHATPDAPTPASARQLFATVAAGPDASPWTTRSQFELGQIAYQDKPPRLDEAAAAFKKVMAANGGSPPEDLAAPALYFLGWTEFDQKKYVPAAAFWEAVGTRYPKMAIAADAAFHRGIALREAGDFAKALAAFEAYAATFPKGKYLARSRQLAAACLTSLERFPDAQKLLAALAADPSTVSETVLYDLAWADKLAKDDVGAVEAYRRLLKDYEATKLAPAARTELAELLIRQNKPADAVDLLEAVAAAKDVEPKVRSLAMALLGTAYQGAGKPEKAAAAFAAYAKEFPDDKFAADALLQAGETAVKIGHFADAEKSYGELVQRFPTYPKVSLVQLKLAEAQADQGKFDDALASHQSFLTKYPKDDFAFRAQFGCGWALENLHKYQPARDAYAKVIATNNGETAARAQFQIGETLCEEGNFEKAVPALLAVEDVYAYPKWSARALLEAGKAFEQLKQLDQAKKQYETIATKYKDLPDEVKLAAARLKELKG